MSQSKLVNAWLCCYTHLIPTSPWSLYLYLNYVHVQRILQILVANPYHLPRLIWIALKSCKNWFSTEHQQKKWKHSNSFQSQYFKQILLILLKSVTQFKHLANSFLTMLSFQAQLDPGILCLWNAFLWPMI